MEDKSKITIGNKSCIFWQTSINDQRPKLRVLINGIVIVGLIDMGVDVSTIIPESWHPNLASLIGRCSITRNWNYTSSETMHEVG